MIPRNHTPTLRRVAVVICATLTACGGGASSPDGKPDAPFGSIDFTSPPPSVVVFQGHSVTTAVRIARVDNTDPVTLSASGMPTGVTIAFDPGVLTGTTLSSTITLTAATDAPAPVAGPVTITATGTHGVSATTQFPLTVAKPQVNVIRTGSGTGTVTSTPGGINCGSTCGSGFAYGTAVTLTAAPAAGSAFGGWSGTACSGTSTTCSFTITATTNVTATFDNTAQGFSFAITPAPASVPQGGNASANVDITRTNGYAGAVTLAVTGAPSGLTVAANPTSITGNTATLNLSAASTLAAGNYPVTVSATGAGIAGTQTTTLNVLVTSAPGGSDNVMFNFASCDPSAVPTWLAVQNGTGAWTRVAGGPNNTFTLAVGATAGVAYAHPDGTGFSTAVFYGSRNDVLALALGDVCEGLTSPQIGTKKLSGSISSVAFNGATTVVIGGALAEIPAPPSATSPSTFSMDGVPAGSRDLIASVVGTNQSGATVFPRFILRRGVNYSAAIPPLDLGGNSAEAFTPKFAPIFTFNRGSNDVISATTSLVTANGVSAEYVSIAGGPAGGVGYVGLPDSQLQPSDLHAVTVVATPNDGATFRAAIVMHHSMVGDSVTFGPALNQPTVNTTGTSPYLKLRAQLASQSEYNTAVHAEFGQGANSVFITTTANYLGATPASWSVEIPDLTSAGYDPAWGLKSGSPVDWLVLAGGESFLPLLGAAAFDHMRMLAAGVSSSSSAFNRLGRFKRW